MEYLKAVYHMLPRSLRGDSDGRPAEQAVLSTKTAVSLLCASCSINTGSDVSELPYYGRSPPVYPSRNVFFASLGYCRPG